MIVCTGLYVLEVYIQQRKQGHNLSWRVHFVTFQAFKKMQILH